MSLDHGVLSGTQRRRTHGSVKRQSASIEREIDQATKAIAVEHEQERREAKAEYAERNKPVPFTPEELKAARFVRTSTGWHRVRRVNAKSVTVDTAYSWTDNHPLKRILEVRA